ncbi:amidohydrolase [Roseibium sediminis]|uniref:amidohydrolase n=1 Tax=Roseibium sediminis TaxID=1775174 RepID=UPI00123DEF0B|nr:amidohydrolase [Roseibium sediminis]
MTLNADIVIENAAVLTMDPSAPTAEAVAISGNRIMAVGTRADLASCKGSGTQVFDANGSSVIPGFIESHMHIYPGSAQIDRLSLAGMHGLEDITKAVRERAATEPSDEILVVEQAHYNILGDHISLDRHVLDEILPDRPMCFYAGDHHTMWANTAALEASGLIHGKKVSQGCEVVMGSDGLANGELREFEAYQPIVMMTQTRGREANGLSSGRYFGVPVSAEERAGDIAALRRGFDYCASLGITSFHNMDSDPHQMELLGEMDAASPLTVRAFMPFRMLPGYPLSDYEMAEDWRRRYDTPRLKMRFVKMFIDGVIEATTAFMLDDYSNTPGIKGEPLFDRTDFIEQIVEADRLGFQVAVHAIGDAGVRWTLDAYEEARRRNGQRDSRHRIEHIETLDPADLPRFAELGVIASVQPTHAPGGYYPMEPIATMLGEQRLRTAYATETLRQYGARIAFASDWPVAPLDPLLGIQTAMTRKPLYTGAPDQRSSLMNALAGYTTDAAYTEFAEHERGQLRPGMLADITMLSGNIENTAPEEITGLKVGLTICDGRVTYQA